MKRLTLALVFAALPAFLDRPAQAAREKPERSEPAPANADSKSNAAIVNADVDETANFIKQNSPNRFKAMKNKRPGPLMVARYIEMRNLKAEDETLYNLRVEEMKQEDVIFPLVSKYLANRTDPAAKDELDKQVGELIKLRIKEHEHRIARLNELLSAEEKKLSELQKPNAVQRRENTEILQNEGGNRPGRALGGARHEDHDVTPGDSAE
jgi:hypothetical protein